MELGEFKEGMSFNNKLIVEPYKNDKIVKSEVRSGLAFIGQKKHSVPLKLLLNAKLNDGTIILKGSTVYIKEELLFTQEWAKKVLESEATDGQYMLVDLINVEFIKP